MMSFSPTMLDSFELKGFWGLPSMKNSEWLRGTITYSPEEGIQLTLEGSFELIEKGKPFIVRGNASVSYPIIHGITDEGKKISVLEVLGFPLPNLGRSMTQTYRAKWMVVDEYVPAPEDMRYKSVRVRFHNLEEFIGQLPTAVTMNSDGRELSIRYKEPETLTIDLGDFQVATAHDRSFPIPASFLTNTIAHTGWFKISPSDPSGAHIEEFLRGPIYSLQCLLSLIAGCRVPIITIRGENERTLAVFEDERIQMPATVIRWQGAHLPVPERRSVVGPQPHGLLFTLVALGKDLSVHVRRWHEAHQHYRQSFELYFSLDPEVDDNVAVEFHFLALITAIESYHADAHESCSTCKDRKTAKQRRRDVIIDSLSHAEGVGPETSEWAKAVLRNSVGPSLGERVSEIFDEQPPQIQRLLGEKDEFVSFVKRSRHSLAHGRSASRNEEITLRELWRATKKLRLILQVMFLQNMKLPQELLTTILPNIHEYRLLQVSSSGSLGVS